MTKLLMLSGLPGSGKSTYAKSLKGYKRVNMDDLRSMLDDGKWSKHNEKVMQSIREQIIIELLVQGHNVVVDDTNFHPKHPALMHSIAKAVWKLEQLKVQVEFKRIDTPLQDCIKRDLKRANSVGSKVIMRMYNEYFEENHPEPPEWDVELPTCIIVDIDGTVAKMNGRGPYDWDRVGEDLPKNEIIDLVKRYEESGSEIIFVSGRDGRTRDTTVQWIMQHIPLNPFEWQLHMRPEGDQRKDTVIKEEIYNREIRGKYNVELVLDDRNCVVDMWRRLGLTCLQVAPGDF